MGHMQLKTWCHAEVKLEVIILEGNICTSVQRNGTKTGKTGKQAMKLIFVSKRQISIQHLVCSKGLLVMVSLQ